MKISKTILDSYNVIPIQSRVPKNNMKIEEIISMLESDCQRFKEKSDLYLKTDDPNIKMDCIDIAITKINDIIQIFKDISFFIEKRENRTIEKTKSLRASIRFYQSLDLEHSENEMKFLDNLLLRNEITHDYFNRDIHYEELIEIIINYSQGAIDLSNAIRNYCFKKGYFNDYLNECKQNVEDYPF